MTLLLPGDAFPDIIADRWGGGVLRLPAATAGHYGVVLFARAAAKPGCPLGKSQREQAGTGHGPAERGAGAAQHHRQDGSEDDR